MSDVTLRNMPVEMHEALKVRAFLRGRSMNGEAVDILASNCTDRQGSVEEILADIEAFRLTLSPSFVLDEDEVQLFKQAGRK